MDLSNIQLIVFAAIGVIVLVGVLFVIQDARAHSRQEEQYTKRKATRPAMKQEHEPA
jgi:uncharacterized protein HemY